jgi:hypothetical protein
MPESGDASGSGMSPLPNAQRRPERKRGAANIKGRSWRTGGATMRLSGDGWRVADKRRCLSDGNRRLSDGGSKGPVEPLRRARGRARNLADSPGLWPDGGAPPRAGCARGRREPEPRTTRAAPSVTPEIRREAHPTDRPTSSRGGPTSIGARRAFSKTRVPRLKSGGALARRGGRLCAPTHEGSRHPSPRGRPTLVEPLGQAPRRPKGLDGDRERVGRQRNPGACEPFAVPHLA